MLEFLRQVVMIFVHQFFVHVQPKDLYSSRNIRSGQASSVAVFHHHGLGLTIGLVRVPCEWAFATKLACTILKVGDVFGISFFRMCLKG